MSIMWGKILDKKVLISIFIIFVLLFVSYFLLKDDYFYALIRTMTEYPDYYIEKYLGSDASKLLLNGMLVLPIEPALFHIFSSLHVYNITQSGIIFELLMFALPFLIFHLVSELLHDEIFQGFYRSVLFRIGKVKYMVSNILGIGLMGGLVAVLPKLLYFLALQFLFPNSYNLETIQPILYGVEEFFQLGYHSIQPDMLIYFDLAMSFLYGIFIAYVSLAILTISRNRLTGYIAMGLLLFGYSIFSVFALNNQQLIFHYFSIFRYLSFANASVSIGFMTLFIYIILFLLVSSTALYLRIRKEI